MGTEVLPSEMHAPEVLATTPDDETQFAPCTSTCDRPFKLMVQTETFLIDAESLRKLSPIFSLMCFGKDFDKMDYSREIVDEKSKDIETFLKAVDDYSIICVRNFDTILRLSHKYQVESVTVACEDFVRGLNLSKMSAEDVLKLVLACHEFHSPKDVMVKLIRRLADEEKTTFNRLKLSRCLPAQIYGAVIGANLNLCQIREVEQMNGHWFKTVCSRARWRRAPCQNCNKIMDCASCDYCHKTMCKEHTAQIPCPNDYGRKMLVALKENVVELQWE